MNTLSKVPTLKIVPDSEASTKLRELLKDADDGFRRVVKVGLYIEWIAANLKQGQFMPWLEAHAPDVSQRSIYNWRSLAKNLCEWSNLKFASLANLPMSADKLLDAPSEKLTPQLQNVQKKMNEALAESHSAKQLFLFLGFKQGEIDASTGYPKTKRGRAKGSSGLSKKQREEAALRKEQATLNEMEAKTVEWIAWMLEMADADHLGRMSDALIKKSVEAADTLSAFGKRTLASRKGATK